MKKLADYTRYTSLALSFGILMAGSLYLGYLGGDWLDRKLGTFPFFLVIGLVLAATYALFSMVTRLRSLGNPPGPGDDWRKDGEPPKEN
ncbi:MAG: AtpZ/AtpI family protein [Bacillota bacterium]